MWKISYKNHPQYDTKIEENDKWGIPRSELSLHADAYCILVCNGIEDADMGPWTITNGDVVHNGHYESLAHDMANEFNAG